MSADSVSIKDFEILAAKKLTEDGRKLYMVGATDQQTLKENSSAFKEWRFQPRVLRDVSNVDMSSSILGDKIPFPVCVAPAALMKLASQGGELDAAKAAASLKTGQALASWAHTSMEEIQQHAPSVLRWFQLYIFKDRELTKNFVKRAEKNGFRALMLTVDAAAFGINYEMARGFTIPAGLSFKNFKDGEGIYGFESYYTHMTQTATWEDVDWLKTITKLPIIIKGILTAEMALEALDRNVAGIVVSNHGGNMLDGVLPSINALPQVVKAVNGKCEIYLDGGIRNGGDVAKAIALGARAVFVGRPVIWGLASDGEAGAKKVLEILRDEFELTMKLLGVTSISELQSVPNLVIHESKVEAMLREV